jgi:hypothetical protein
MLISSICGVARSPQQLTPLTEDPSFRRVVSRSAASRYRLCRSKVFVADLDHRRAIDHRATIASARTAGHDLDLRGPAAPVVGDAPGERRGIPKRHLLKSCILTVRTLMSLRTITSRYPVRIMRLGRRRKDRDTLMIRPPDRGWLFFWGEARSCVGYDVSRTCARLHSDGLGLLPVDFYVTFDDFLTVGKCRLTWRHRDDIRVVFEGWVYEDELAGASNDFRDVIETLKARGILRSRIRVR